jgi:hypothetical protein
MAEQSKEVSNRLRKASAGERVYFGLGWKSAMKFAEALKSSHNTDSPKLPTFIEICELVERSHVGTLSERELMIVNRVRDIVGSQLRAGA